MKSKNPKKQASREPLNKDFSKLGLHADICEALERASLSEFGHTAIDTQRRAFHSLELFSQSLRGFGCGDDEKLHARSGQIFADWLNKSHLGLSAQWHLNVVVRILRWCQRNVPSVLSSRLSLLVSRIRQPSRGPRKITDADTLKKILHACYEEIEIVERVVARGRSLRTGEKLAAEDQEAHATIQKLLKLGNGFLPTQLQVRKSAPDLRRFINRLGGYGALGKLLWISPEQVFPFFLAILIQASANPGELPAAKRDCITPHILRSDLELIKWPKNRSRKEQHAEFPVGRSWSAPNLARRLMVLNAELDGLANSNGKNKLFTCLVTKRRTIKVPTKYSFQSSLRDFISRHDLPKFGLKNLRGSGAVIYYKEGHSIQMPKRRLNHADSRTTEIYCDPAHLGDEHDLTIRRFQGEFVRISLESVSTGSKPIVCESGQQSKIAAETLFGFGCKDLFGGIAPGAKKGEMCQFFTGCATCPGALVLVDDPGIVAHLLESLDSLEEARKRAITEGWWERYELLYEPTREILATEILPLVSEPVIQIARTLVSPRLVPFLE